MKIVHCKKEPYDVYIGRGSKWGNPFTHKHGTIARFVVDTRNEAIECYEVWIREQPELMASLPKLVGKTLGCYCVPKRCHGEVLIKIVNEMLEKEKQNE
jgi:hypothetical protein